MGTFLPSAYLISQTVEWAYITHDVNCVMKIVGRTGCRQADWFIVASIYHEGHIDFICRIFLQNVVPNTIYVPFKVHSFGVF
jgi:hypothetical protein